MAECTFAYPAASDFNTAAPNVIAFIRGTDPTVDAACAVHCGWVCVGYFQDMLLPCGGHAPMRAASGGVMCRAPEDVAAGLQCVLDCHTKSMAVAGFDWASLLQVLVPLILSWLQKK